MVLQRLLFNTAFFQKVSFLLGSLIELGGFLSTSSSYSPTSRIEFWSFQSFTRSKNSQIACILPRCRSVLALRAGIKRFLFLNLTRCWFSSPVPRWVRRFFIYDCLSNNYPYLSIYSTQFLDWWRRFWIDNCFSIFSLSFLTRLEEV